MTKPLPKSSLHRTILALTLMLLTLTGCGGGSAPTAPTPTPDPTLGGRLAFAKGSVDGQYELYAMNANGSSEVRLTSGLHVQGEPKWSPDGGSILFAAQPLTRTQIYVLKLAAGAPNTVNLSANHGGMNSDETLPNWSPDGSRIVYASNQTGGYQVYAMKADGSDVQPLTLSQKYGYSSWPAYSPDGTRVAYTAGGTPDQTELFIINVDGGGVHQLTSHNTLVARPVWSPPGDKLVFTFQRGVGQQRRYNVYLIGADGGGERALANGDFIDQWPKWSPDGQHIIFFSNRAGGAGDDVYLASPTNTSITPLTSGGGLYPSYSPDGQHIIYARRPSAGQPHRLYVMDSDGGNPHPLSGGDGDYSYPVWR